MATAAGERRPLAQRLLWFAGLWAGGVLTVGTVAYLLRAVMAAL
jgi:hypothetical protein